MAEQELYLLLVLSLAASALRHWSSCFLKLQLQSLHHYAALHILKAFRFAENYTGDRSECGTSQPPYCISQLPSHIDYRLQRCIERPQSIYTYVDMHAHWSLIICEGCKYEPLPWRLEDSERQPALSQLGPWIWGSETNPSTSTQTFDLQTINFGFGAGD